MSELVVDLIARRRDRAIAAILGVKERECDPHLPAQVSKRLRKVVLDQLNDFTSMIEDLLASMEPEEGVVLNDLWLAKIAEIHEVVTGNGVR